MGSITRWRTEFRANFVSVGLLVLGLSLLAAVSHARPPQQLKMLDKFALVKGEGMFRAGGIVVLLQGKPTVVVSSQVVGERVSICDINEREIAFSGILFPKESADVVFLELADSAAATPALEIVNVIENFSLGEKVFVYGFDDLLQSVAQCKGKIVGIGPDQIKIEATVKSAFRGGVVVSEAGSMVGFCRANPLPKRGFELHCLRLDKLSPMSRLTPEQYAAETAGIRELRSKVDGIHREVNSFAETVDLFGGDVNSGKNVSLPKIANIENRCQQYESMYSSLISRWRDQADVRLPFLRPYYAAEISRAGMVLTRLQECRASLATIREAHLEWLRSRKVNKKL